MLEAIESIEIFDGFGYEDRDRADVLALGRHIDKFQRMQTSFEEMRKEHSKADGGSGVNNQLGRWHLGNPVSVASSMYKHGYYRDNEEIGGGLLSFVYSRKDESANSDLVIASNSIRAAIGKAR